VEHHGIIFKIFDDVPQNTARDSGCEIHAELTENSVKQISFLVPVANQGIEDTFVALVHGWLPPVIVSSKSDISHP